MNHEDHVPTLTGLVIGDELLSGKVKEENMSFLIQECRKLGVRLDSIHILPDRTGRLAEAIRSASGETDYVVTSGGLGPTHDDRTMDAVARAFEKPVVRNSTYEETLRSVYQDVDETVLSMADMPEGIDFVWGDSLDIPAARYKNVFILPGDPRLFRSKFSAIRNELRTSHVFHVQNIYVDMNESDLSPMLGQLQEQFPDVDIGSYPTPWNDEYKEMVTIESTDEGSVRNVASTLLDQLPSECIVRQELRSTDGTEQ